MTIELLDVDELAETLKVSKATVYAWVHTRYIPFIKVGRRVRFDAREVDLWLKKRSNPGRSRQHPGVAIGA